ncbi:hypothetical protein GCM10027271_57340 [Saccharopolyspora gloriosae]|uniref:DUF1542 domain-containing protein n=1 Tax=Saccharopolyspora gloriosae TaxID=455344 RepID=A0A840NC81_9PSEU|nr:hypothetical protein [Saccharopolyspora gloriosae]MBB5067818.1 hypothetical protein [Saccharopolyspora gloriosae]
MSGALILIIVAAVVLVGALWWSRRQTLERSRKELDDSRAEARRWVERLGGQVLNIDGTDEASKQAMADAAERHNAAVSQLDQASSAEQCRLTTQTAMEGLYYVRAARTAMGLDPGPELPDLSHGAGKVTEHREVEVEGRQQVASPSPSDQTPHYYPGGRVAGRPVPEGWYSEPWWKPALVAGAWGAGSFLLMSAMFSGMPGVSEAAYADGFQDGQADMGDPGDMADAGDGGDFGDFDFDLGDFGF